MEGRYRPCGRVLERRARVFVYVRRTYLRDRKRAAFTLKNYVLGKFCFFIAEIRVHLSNHLLQKLYSI